jgi:DNA-binding NarL/FixJ family response regulator
VLADDHLIFRQGIKRIIENAEGIRVVGEAGDGLELVNLLKKIEADLVILDISMPKLRGIEAAREIKRMWPDLKILILSMHRNQDHLCHAISARADGYMLKDDSDTELFAAISKIQKDEFYLSPILSDDYKNEWINIVKQTTSKKNVLTTREIEVLKLIAEGKRSKEIGKLLFISKRTIDTHRANIIKKLNLKTIADLTRYAISSGYIQS